MSSHALAALLYACLACIPALAQSYQSAFSEPKYDTTHGPAQQFGNVQVDPATGHVSMRMPLGPGIGARGVHFQPMASIDFAPVRTEQETYTDPLIANGITVPYEIFDIMPGGQYADYISFSEHRSGSTLASLTPGFLELATPLRNQPGEDPLTRFQVGDMSGVTQERGVLPTGLNIPGVLSKFGYASQGNEPEWSDYPQSTYARIASGRYLVLALGGTAFPVVQRLENRYGLRADPSAVKRNYPSGFLVVDGDVAYEFSLPRFLVQSTFKRISDTSGNYLLPIMATLHVRYRLTRILNAFGDDIRFTYTGRTFTGAYDSGTYLVPDQIQAKWYRGGGDIQTSILMTFHKDEPTHRYTVSYLGGTQTLSYSIGAASRPSGGSIGVHVQSQNDPPPPPPPPLPPSIFDDVSSPTFYVCAGGLYIDNPWDLPNADGIWTNVPVDSVVQDQTGERIDLLCQATDLPAGPFSLWPGLAWAAYSQNGNAPTRAVVLTWSDEYSFLDTRGPFLNMRQGHCWTQGVVKVDEIVAGPSERVTRSTSYDRYVPSPLYTDFATTGGVPGPPGPDGWVVAQPIQWASTAFSCKVTYPDGISTTYTYAPPNGSSDTLAFQAFAKNVVIKEEWRGSKGTLFKTITHSALNTYGLGNPGGTTDTTQTRSAVPYPTHWEIQDILNGRLEVGDLQNYDSSNYAWQVDKRIINNASGALFADRTTTRVMDSSGSALFLYGRPSKETLNGKPPVYRSFDPNTTHVTQETYGESNGPQVQVHQDWASDGTLTQAWLSSFIGAKYQYDPRGFLSGISPMDPSLSRLSTQQTQDALGWVTSQTDANGIRTGYSWDGSGRLVQLAPPSSEASRTLMYDLAALKTRVEQGAQKEEHVYQGFGDQVITRRFNSDGSSNQKAYGYDDGGRLMWETVWRQNLGSVVDWTRPTAPADQPNYVGSMSYTYDEFGRVTKVVNPNNEVTTYGYNPGQTIITLAPGTTTQQVTVRTFDPLGRLSQIVDALNQVTAYTYDDADRIKTVTQHAGAVDSSPQQVRTWNYDALGRLITLIQPESGTTSYSNFTLLGKPQITIYGDGSIGPKTVTTAYDNAGRVVQVTGADVSQSFAYDELGHGYSNGKLTTATDGTVTRALSYNGLNGRLSGLMYAMDGLVFNQTIQYDATYGLPLRRTYPDGLVQILDYDWAKGTPKSSGFGSNPSSSDLVSSLSYDSTFWGLNQIAYANGASSFFTYDLDQARLGSMIHAIPGQPSKAWSYHYNPAGQLTTDGEDTYTYDNLGRLTAALVQDPFGNQSVSQNFTYDAFGNRLSSNTSTPQPRAGLDKVTVNMTFNAGDPELLKNQLPANTAANVPTGAAYDAQGNLTQVYKTPTSVNPSVLTMNYDALARVTSLGDTSNATSQTYTYDDQGLRIKIVDSSTGKITYNIYNEARQLVAVCELVLE